MSDYPRPARAERIEAHVVILLGGEMIAEARQVVRTPETSPRRAILPREAIRPSALLPADGASFCEGKEPASYFAATGGS